MSEFPTSAIKPRLGHAISWFGRQSNWLPHITSWLGGDWHHLKGKVTMQVTSSLPIYHRLPRSPRSSPTLHRHTLHTRSRQSRYQQEHQRRLLRPVFTPLLCMHAQIHSISISFSRKSWIDASSTLISALAWEHCAGGASCRCAYLVSKDQTLQLFSCCTECARHACACAFHKTDFYTVVPAGAAAGTNSSKHLPAGIQPGRAALQPGYWAAGSSICSSPSTGTAGLAAAAAADQPLSTSHPVPCRPGVLPKIMPLMHIWQS